MDPDALPVATVQLTFEGGAATDTIPVRGTAHLRAVALARQGRILDRSDFTFTSADTTIARVDASGIVRGVRAGTTRIVATLPEGMRAEATLVVASAGVAYTIPTGGAPGAMAFSTDYARLFVLTSPDSLAIVDALGFFRLDAIPLGLPGHQVAATQDAILVTHPDADSISVLSASTNALQGRVWIGAGPTGIVAAQDRAYVAARYDRRIVFLDGTQVAGTVMLDGEPHDLAVSRDGRRLFATVERTSDWRLAIVAPATADTLASLPLSSAPTAITTDAAGTRVYVLLPQEQRVAAFAAQADGSWQAAGGVSVGASAGGLSMAPSGAALVVSGEPTIIIGFGATMTVDSVTNVGTGPVGVRPDGVFAFVAAPAARLLRVLGL
jgi:DNA-binding beta-propeller fold protein YncE